MKIYTKTGDKGQTGLYDGTRIDKDNIRVESYGTIDELDSSLGFARNFVEDSAIVDIIYKIQHDLFRVAAQLATPGDPPEAQRVSPADVERLEKLIDYYIERMPKGDMFIIPGSNKAAASLHVARTICRRAERRIISLSRLEPVDPILMKYVNRLSDCIYSMARYLETDVKFAHL